MVKKSDVSVQKTIDGYINTIFLGFMPHSIRPNHVTAVRFALVPVIYYFLSVDALAIALVLFIIAASTDFIDGAMARTRNQITDLGKVIDPIADKSLILTALSYFGFNDPLVRIFAIFIIFETCAVLIGYFFSSTLGKPMGANVFGKVKLILQSVSVGLFMLGVLIRNRGLIISAEYVLYVALLFAIMAGLETARRKALYWKENKIFYNQKNN